MAELSEARTSVSVSCACWRLVGMFSIATVTDGMRANDSRDRGNKNSYHNLSPLHVPLPRQRSARLGEWPTARGRTGAASIEPRGRAKRLEALIRAARRLRAPG